MDESAVSNAAITDAAELLTQKADMLLERLADRVMATPTPGSRAWYAHRSTAADSAKERLLVRIAIAHQAHFDLAEDIARARAAGAGWAEIGEVTHLSAPQARTRWDTTPAPSRRYETDQLTIKILGNPSKPSGSTIAVGSSTRLPVKPSRGRQCATMPLVACTCRPCFESAAPESDCRAVRSM
ncbi:hypothetical protein [Rhodococcus koreensis]